MNDSEQDQGLSLNSLFSTIKIYVTSEICSLASYEATKASSISSGIPIDEKLEKVQKCIDLVNTLGLISKNEDIDDISTTSIKYFALWFYMGNIHIQVTDLSKRYNHLRQAKKCFEMFLQTCIRHNIFKGKDIGYDEDGEFEEEIESAETKRNRKIALYKKNRECQNRIQALANILRQSSGVNDLEEDLRELYVLELKAYALEAVSEISSTSQEMQLLRLREDMNDSTTETAPYIPPEPPKIGEGPGITVTKINKIGDKLVTTREQVKASVFTPRMSAPTMTIEEYGDIVKAQAEAATEANAAKEGQGPPLRYKQLVQEGKEDDEELLDQATIADRDWDAFKEANPRGWGNKMNKRY